MYSLHGVVNCLNYLMLANYRVLKEPNNINYDRIYKSAINIA